MTQMAAPAAEPLHVRIDRALAQSQSGPVALPSADEEFIRRLHLDFIGRIPSAVEARAFLGDNATDKRAKVMDRLLLSPEHARHMSRTIDIMWMERRPEKHVKTADWQAYLMRSFSTNQPYDKLVAELFLADGNATTSLLPREPARFILDRDGEPHLVTRDVGRVFFGVDFQCAQCHDHPKVDDYLQRDYYGLQAFIARTTVFQPDPKYPAMLAEKAAGESRFKSVFTKYEGETRPRLYGAFESAAVDVAPGTEWVVAPDDKQKNLRPIPKVSRRAQLAAQAPANLAFRRNIANRLWWHMMGRGLVEPLDGFSADNEPTHPELLDLLASEFAAMNFDMRAFLRELAMTQLYQRSSRPPPTLTLPTPESLAALEAEAKVLAPKAELSEAAWKKAVSALNQAVTNRMLAGAELDKAVAAQGEARKALDAAAKVAADATTLVATKQDLHKVTAEAAAKAKLATDKLPADKELADAGAKFLARSLTLAAELAAAQKDSDAKTTATKAATDRFALAEKFANDNRTRWNGLDQLVLGGDRAVQVAASEHQTNQFNLAKTKRRLDDSKALAEFVPLDAAARAATASFQAADKNYAPARQSLTSLQAAIAAARDGMVAAQTNRDSTGALLLELQKQVAAKADGAKAVTDAAVLAEAARLKLPNDAELAAAAAKFKMRGEQLNAELVALQKQVPDRDSAAKAAAEKLAGAQKLLAAEEAKLPAAQKALADIEPQWKALQAAAADSKAKADAAYDRLSQRWATSMATGVFAHLTPEQLCWSILQGAGTVDAQRVAAEAEFNQKNPLPAGQPEDANRTATRLRTVEQLVNDRLKGNEAVFVRLFGGEEGQPQVDFYATAEQALFFANGGTVSAMLAPSGNNLVARLNLMADAKAVADELYLTVLTRRPVPDELADVERQLAARPKEQRVAALQEMAWGLMTSVEFRFRH